MSSRSEQIRQLGLKGKIMYKSGTSSKHAKVLDQPDTQDNLLDENIQSFISSVAPLECSPSIQVPVLESEFENQVFLFNNNSYTALTPVTNVIIIEDTTITESPIIDTTQKEVRSYHDPDSGQDYQEDPFQNSGSSYNPSDTDVQSDASSDILPLARLIQKGEPECDSSRTVVKRAKKGFADPLKWQVNKTKLLRMKGQEYISNKKEKDGRKSRVERKPRQLGSRCNSEKCQHSKNKRQCSLISEEDRHRLFKRFWSEMDWRQRKTYVVAMVTKIPTKQKTTNKNSKRKISLFYHIQIGENLIPVCKKLFLSTLGLGEWSVNNWVKNSDSGIPNIPEEYPGKIKIVNENKRQGIRSFFEKLPKLPSHYCRSSTSKLYLEPLFRSYSEVYEVYKKEVQNPTGKDVFVGEMKTMNIDIFQPRKDQCDLCFANKLGHIDNDTYDKHIAEKNNARREKDKDKVDAIAGNSSAFTADVQAVQLVPQLHASMLYFKQKLACHNYTIYNLATKAVVCYVWHEGEGGMDSNCFATCLTDFLDNEISVEEKEKPIIFYSDGCSAQNRNALLSNVLLNYSIYNSTEIMQKYLVKGHTQMECDSVHSTIECRKKNREIYSPSNYVQLIEDSRRNLKSGPYKVKYVDHTFFLNFSDVKYFNSIRPGKKAGDARVTDISALRYTKADGIQYKLGFEDNWAPLPSRQLSSVGTVKKLYDDAVPISCDKFNSLQTLKSVIHKDFHPFYDSLSHE